MLKIFFNNFISILKNFILLPQRIIIFMNIKYILSLVFTSVSILAACQSQPESQTDTVSTVKKDSIVQKEEPAPKVATLDTAAFNRKLKYMANGDTTGLWPIKNQPYPLPGALLPFNRIVAYYGNLYSKRMGALGEYPPKEMWRRLNAEVALWEKVDTATPVIPAIHYIAAVAQATPMKDSSYTLRMPSKQIDSALTIAKMGDAIVFLDIQVGLSDVRKEVPRLEKYLKMTHVHLGVDPEFYMRNGNVPGTKIGSMDAEDINFCTEYLAKLVRQYNLPPKIFVIHRFTRDMVTNWKNIKLRPEVQIVMDMDGWGEAALKLNTYKQFVYKQPVHFAGFKLFYKNDVKKEPKVMLTPAQLMKLKPLPSYIQYQ